MHIGQTYIFPPTYIFRLLSEYQATQQYILPYNFNTQKWPELGLNDLFHAVSGFLKGVVFHICRF